MAGDNGGTDSENGVYGPVGPVAGSTPSPNPNQGPAGPAGAPGVGIETLFQARMQRDSAVQISLQRYKGYQIVINGEVVTVPSGGMARLSTDNLIVYDGADAGVAPAINTLYYVYVSNEFAVFSPSSIRLSETAPSMLNGEKYLGTTGNAANWRFVGWVRTISNGGTPNFADSLTQRLVINYHNPLDLPMFICPGYVDDGVDTTYNEADSPVWKEIHGGVDSRLEFISNGEDGLSFQAEVYWEWFDVNDFLEIGLGRDSATSPTREASASFGATAISGNISLQENYKASEGYHYLALLVLPSVSVAGALVYADSDRAGGDVDPALTFITGSILG